MRKEITLAIDHKLPTTLEKSCLLLLLLFVLLLLSSFSRQTIYSTNYGTFSTPTNSNNFLQVLVQGYLKVYCTCICVIFLPYLLNCVFSFTNVMGKTFVYMGVITLTIQTVPIDL